MPIVNFVNEKKQIEVPKGTNLRRAALDSGVKIYDGVNGVGAAVNEIVNCYGFGMCGSCRVLVTKGMENTSPMGMLEKAKFNLPVPDPLPSMAYIGHEGKMRLACQCEVNGDIDVVTKPQLNLFGENFFS